MAPVQTLGTCVVVLDKDKKKLLLGKRLNSHGSGIYGLPGGRLEIQEQVLDCGKRELLEEAGLTVNKIEFLGVVRDLQEDYSFIHFALLCQDYLREPEVMEPDKCEGWEWFSFESLPENILLGHKAAIDIFLNPDNNSLRDISSV